VGRLIIEAITAITVGSINTETILDAIYRSTTFNIDGLTLGPYLDNACFSSQLNGGSSDVSSSSSSPLCECNQGMHSVWITRYNSSSSLTPFMYAVNNDASRSVFQFSTCGVVFKPYVRATLTSSVNMLAIVLPCGFGVLVIAAMMTYKLTANYRQLQKLYSNEVEDYDTFYDLFHFLLS